MTLTCASVSNHVEKVGSLARLQTIDTLIFCGMDSLDRQETFVSQLSGIDYSGHGDIYYAMPECEGSKAHYFLFSISHTDHGLQAVIVDTIYLNSKLDTLEGESIRRHPETGQLYIVEERITYVSNVFKVDQKGRLQNVYTSNPRLIQFNKGFEGLSFNSDGSKMLIALERLAEDVHFTRIIEYAERRQSQRVFIYPLDNIPGDESDNGITEILHFNDSTLIVVERAYVKSAGKTSVRVYKVVLPNEFSNHTAQISSKKLLTQFENCPVPKTDNIEGVTFSASGRELIFVSDNNNNPKYQQTQFICMKIE